MPLSVIEVKILRRIVYPVFLVAVSLIVAVFYPMLMLLFYAGTFVLLFLSQQLNFYKIVMVLKRYARNIGSKLRFEIRGKLHLGFRDYSNASLDGEEEWRRRTRAYFR